MNTIQVPTCRRLSVWDHETTKDDPLDREKRGVGIYWKNVKKEGFNPKTNQHVLTDKPILHTDFELPMREAYNKFTSDLLEKHEPGIVKTAVSAYLPEVVLRT